VSNRDNLAIGAVLRLFQGFFATKINKIYYNNTALTSSELSKLAMLFSNQNNYYGEHFQYHTTDVAIENWNELEALCKHSQAEYASTIALC
jgi:hypothetical protein